MSADQRRRIVMALVVVVALVLGAAVLGAVVAGHRHPHAHGHLLGPLLAVALALLVPAALTLYVVRRWPEVLQPSPLLAIEGSRTRRQAWRAAMKGQPVAEEHRDAVRATAERTDKNRWLVWIYLGNAVLQLALAPTAHLGVGLFHAVLGVLFLALAAMWWRMAERARHLAARLSPSPTGSEGQTAEPR